MLKTLDAATWYLKQITMFTSDESNLHSRRVQICFTAYTA